MNIVELSFEYSLYCFKQSAKINIFSMLSQRSPHLFLNSRSESTFKDHTLGFTCISPLTTYCAYISKACLSFKIEFTTPKDLFFSKLLRVGNVFPEDTVTDNID